ncbi:MAG TPA: ArsA family ATPase [Thermoleophilia bacterium]|nr:ArsA family ATPase [Thermoleophilia bacterium]
MTPPDRAATQAEPAATQAEPAATQAEPAATQARPRVLLFTGKGGVGKTTVAAATALRCAESGRRTLVLSTDAAHSLGDAFDQPLDDRPRQLQDGLWGQQLDAAARLEESWADVQDYLAELFGWAGLAAVEAEELAVIPGLDEIFALGDIRTHADSGQWDVIVVDCAPTAETIRLLSLPDVLAWYMHRVFPASRTVTGLLRPIVSRMTSIPVAGDDVFDAASRLYDRLDGVRGLLTDGRRSSVRLVVNPERMVIAEARRTATYLSLFGYRVDAVVANRLLPAEITDPWFKAWKETHAEHLEAIEAGFAPVPVLRAELAPDEVVGPAALRVLGDSLYDGTDPAAVLHHGETMQIERRGEKYALSVHLPFADRDELELGRRDDELLIRVGPYRRAVMLPDTMRRRQVAGAKLEGEWLEVTFIDGT